MPTLLREGPYRVFFYSDEGDPREPPHVHVTAGERIAKFWLDPVELESSRRLRADEINRLRKRVEGRQPCFWRHGMRTLDLESDPIAVAVVFSADAFRVTLDDGRELSVPLAWFPRLLHGTPEQRQNWDLIGRGEGLHWEELDEDISIVGLLAGHRDRTRRRSHAA